MAYPNDERWFPRVSLVCVGRPSVSCLVGRLRAEFISRLFVRYSICMRVAASVGNGQRAAVDNSLRDGFGWENDACFFYLIYAYW